VAQNCAAGLTIQGNNIQNSGDAGIVVIDTAGASYILSNILVNNGGQAPMSNANSSMYLFASLNEPFYVNDNSTMPAAGTPALFTQGNAVGQMPLVNLMGNAYIDP